MSQAVILLYNYRLREPLYQWDGRFYSAATLEWIQLDANDELEFINNFWPHSNDNYTQQLVLIETEPAWILVSSENNTLILESKTSNLVPERLSQLQMKNAYLLTFPELDLLEPRVYNQLPAREVTNFDVDILNLIRQAILRGLPLTQIGVELVIPQSGLVSVIRINPRSRRFMYNPSKYSTFSERPPEVPQLPPFLIIHGLKVSFIPFTDIANMLSLQQIQSYHIDPLLQYLVGSNDSPNRIITMFGKNGITYLVKARYDPQTNQIFPAV